MKKKSLYLLLLFSGIAQIISAQNTYFLKGEISDLSTGELLAGVSIYVPGEEVGDVSNPDGTYSMGISAGTYQFVFSYIGYEKVIKEITLTGNRTLNIGLNPSLNTLEEVEISAEAPDHNIKSTEMSVEKLAIQEIEQIPVIMGETDIMKTIQLLPGIMSIAEGRSGFIVRGSGIDQNLILMDGMPLYYSSHMQGLYSVFNSDAVNALTIYKGGIPARFGGRGASVLDVRMKESNSKEYRANMSIGLITSKFSMEAPLVKNKLSLFLSGRFTKYSVGSIIDSYSQSGTSGDGKGGSKDADGTYRFFDSNESWMDLNGKLIYSINDNNSLYISAYMGRDSALVVGGLTEWGNQAASLRWNHKFNQQLLSNTSLVFSRYYTAQTGGIYAFKSGITTTSVRQEFSFFPNQRNEIKFGFSSEYQDFNHGGLEDLTQDDAGKFMPPMQGLESAVYLENDQKVNAWFSAYYGLRYSFYHRLGPGDSFVYDETSNEALSSTYFESYTDVMAFHHNLEPRLAFTFLMNDKSSFKLSYNRNAQYLRLMTLGAEIQWYDIWMPSTENIDPMLTDQFALGYFRNFQDNHYRFSAETYYKKLTGAADFEDGLHNYLVDNLEAYVATGKGYSYGLELSLEKPKGRLNGRVSYNIGKSEYLIDVINQGRWYPNMFDKTHSLSMISSYELFDDLVLSATFLYSTGRPVTLPESYYYVNGVPFPYWEGRNKYRLPDYHRLDFGIKYEPDFLSIKINRMQREINTSLELSFYNVYNRRNIYTIEHTTNSPGKEGTEANHVFEAYGLSTYGFMPSFQLNIQF